MGIILLIASLFPIKQLIIRLPQGSLRQRWYLLTGLIVIFLIGYISYGIIYWNHINSLADLIVPGVFFLGACFVWLICSLSLQTTMDIRRVSLLEKENITDPLTGIYNRRYLERRLEEEVILTRQSNSPLSILLIDIDHFKEINDTYGHAVGDVVVNKLANLMLHSKRASDVLARFGGDEFVIIAFNTPPTAAVLFAEHLIRHVESFEMAISDDQNNRIKIKTTVSIGVAGLEENVIGIHQLVCNADEALYCAKRGGRNRTSVYPCFSE